MAPHSSILFWKITWIEEPRGVQSMESQRVGYNWMTEHMFPLYQLCVEFLIKSLNIVFTESITLLFIDLGYDFETGCKGFREQLDTIVRHKFSDSWNLGITVINIIYKALFPLLGIILEIEEFPFACFVLSIKWKIVHHHMQVPNITWMLMGKVLYHLLKRQRCDLLLVIRCLH